MTALEVSGARTPSQTERHDLVTEAVLAAGSMRIDDLTQRFRVSRMTMHRDLEALEARGLLRRSRGTVTAVASSLFEASTEYRTRQNIAEKEAIAEVAASLVTPGEAVILDDSTTALRLAQLLTGLQPLTVITNFGRVIKHLEGRQGITLITTGGEYFQLCDAYRGAITLSALHNLHADTYFMSTPAITNGMCYHPHQDLILVKQAMFSAARRRVLIVDHTKFQRTALHAMAPIEDFDVVIVDSGIDPSDLQMLQQTGVEVVVADVRRPSKGRAS